MVKRKFIAVALAALVAAASGGQASAAILLDSPFADGNRLASGGPTDKPVFVATAGTGSVVTTPGNLAFTMSASSQRMYSHFVADGSEVTLGVGDSLIASFTVSVPNLTATTSQNFRFGLFNDPTNAQVGDAANDSGGTGAPFTDSTGYSVFMNLSNATGASPQIRKRTNLLSTSLLGTTGDHTVVATGTPLSNLVNATAYTGALTLTRTSLTDLGLNFTFSNGATTLASVSGTDTSGIYTTFETMFFRFSNATGTGDVLNFSNLRVEYVPAAVAIPEPGALSLLGVGCALAVFGRFRRKS